ncbi:hypothetical protein AAG906_031196 [Vitis piasezkii]
MAGDKKKVVVQSDNKTRHSPRQKLISEPIEWHVTRQAKHVEAKTKAHFDRPTTKWTEAMHVQAKTKVCFDCSTTPKTIKPTTTPPHPWTTPPTLSPTRSPSLGVCDDAPMMDLSRREFGQEFSYDIKAFRTYEPTTQSMRLLNRYYFLTLMDPLPIFLC